MPSKNVFSGLSSLSSRLTGMFSGAHGSELSEGLFSGQYENMSKISEGMPLPQVTIRGSQPEHPIMGTSEENTPS